MAKTTEINMTKPKELGLEKLRWRCELSRIPFETTAQAQKREGFIGQERALRALKMGVELIRAGLQRFRVRSGGHQPRRHHRPDD